MPGRPGPGATSWRAQGLCDRVAGWWGPMSHAEQAVAECVKLLKGDEVDYLALSVEERIDLLGSIISEPPLGDRLPVRHARCM